MLSAQLSCKPSSNHESQVQPAQKAYACHDKFTSD